MSSVLASHGVLFAVERMRFAAGDRHGDGLVALGTRYDANQCSSGHYLLSFSLICVSRRAMSLRSERSAFGLTNSPAA